jgi:hypothetical protein
LATRKGIVVSTLCLVSLLVLSGSVQLASAATQNPIPPGLYPINPSNTPTALGCFKYFATIKQWLQEQCTPASVARTIPHPISGFVGGTGGNVYGEASKNTIGYGYVDVFPKLNPYAPVPDDSISGFGAYSVQGNTNGFGVSGSTDNYAVQFTAQNLPSDGTDYMCIWSIDVTTQNYNNNCQTIGNISVVVLTSAYMYGWAAGGNLGIEYCINGRTTCWYNSESDSIGLQGHWKSLSGSLLGYGGGSDLQFSSGGLANAVNVETGLYSPKSPYVAGQIGASTGESNTLFYTGNTKPTCSSHWCTMWTYASD